MEEKMPSPAKIYIALIASIATTALAVAAYQWKPANLGQFVLFFALAMVASTMKIRLPGLKTSISINFVFILMGIALFSFSETVLIGLGGALVQSLWRPLHRPKAVQIFFNGACLTVCSAAAFWAAHALPALLGASSAAAMMTVGACVYVLLNTGMVSLVISLAEGQSLKQLWPQCYEWTFPYFLVGAAVAGLASAAGQGSNFGLTLLVVPAMYFVYVYYRMHILRAVLDNISNVSQENEAFLPAHRGSGAMHS
jgi:predicted membrane channel-forming protein YqfA (hemolysin III family)